MIVLGWQAGDQTERLPGPTLPLWPFLPATQ
jgi:hypothetical protein